MEDGWKAISKESNEECNFPHCLGALDGKHIAMECPHSGGSAYFNHKNVHNIVLMAICDAKYCFTLVDIGGYGRENDAGLLSQSPFGQALEIGRGKLGNPGPEQVGSFDLPYVFVGDEIFSLKPWLMKPFPGRNLEEKRGSTTIGSQEPEEQLKILLVSFLPSGAPFEDQSMLLRAQLKGLSKQLCAFITT